MTWSAEISADTVFVFLKANGKEVSFSKRLAQIGERKNGNGL